MFHFFELFLFSILVFLDFILLKFFELGILVFLDLVLFYFFILLILIFFGFIFFDLEFLELVLCKFFNVQLFNGFHQIRVGRGRCTRCCVGGVWFICVWVTGILSHFSLL